MRRSLDSYGLLTFEGKTSNVGLIRLLRQGRWSARGCSETGVIQGRRLRRRAVARIPVGIGDAPSLLEGLSSAAFGALSPTKGPVL
jgi:hypothetical protein